MVALRDHQIEALRKAHSLGGRAGLFIDRGGGKTRAALTYVLLKRCKRILIVLPVSVPAVWEDELRNPAKMGCNDVELVDLTRYQSVKQKAERLRQFGDGIVLINYESYWREPLRAQILKWAPDAILLDEAHRIRHRGTRLSRFAHVLADRFPNATRLALTATPSPNGPQDIWSLFRFVNPQVFGPWRHFEARYIVKGGHRGFQIIGYQNEEELHGVISRHSFQWEDDGREEPPDVEVKVELSATSRKVYERMKKDSIIELNSVGPDTVAIARIVLTLILRLQQITSGFVRTVDGLDVDLSSEKADAAIDLIEDIVLGGKVVVFARFVHDLDILERRIPPHIKFGRIDGSKSSTQRRDVIRQFDGGDIQVMFVQIRAGSEGIDLAAAKAAIFYSVGYSTDQMLQAKGRLTGSLRQRHSVTFYHLICKDSIDEKVYEALSKKLSIARKITDLRYGLDLLDIDKSNVPALASLVEGTDDEHS